MLNKRTAELNALVWETVATLGGNPGRITDAILAENFPRTQAEAAIEGVEKLLRNGLLLEVKRVLKCNTGPTPQIDFNAISPDLMPFVLKLGRPSYWVEAREELVSVGELIASPDLLNDARAYMRRKGDENLAEAKRLDQLYAAVSASLAP